MQDFSMRRALPYMERYFPTVIRGSGFTSERDRTLTIAIFCLAITIPVGVGGCSYLPCVVKRFGHDSTGLQFARDFGVGGGIAELGWVCYSTWSISRRGTQLASTFPICRIRDEQERTAGRDALVDQVQTLNTRLFDLTRLAFDDIFNDRDTFSCELRVPGDNDVGRFIESVNDCRREIGQWLLFSQRAEYTGLKEADPNLFDRTELIDGAKALEIRVAEFGRDLMRHGYSFEHHSIESFYHPKELCDAKGVLPEQPEEALKMWRAFLEKPESYYYLDLRESTGLIQQFQQLPGQLRTKSANN